MQNGFSSALRKHWAKSINGGNSVTSVDSCLSPLHCSKSKRKGDNLSSWFLDTELPPLVNNKPVPTFCTMWSKLIPSSEKQQWTWIALLNYNEKISCKQFKHNIALTTFL